MPLTRPPQTRELVVFKGEQVGSVNRKLADCLVVIELEGEALLRALVVELKGGDLDIRDVVEKLRNSTTDLEQALSQVGASWTLRTALLGRNPTGEHRLGANEELKLLAHEVFGRDRMAMRIQACGTGVAELCARLW